MKKFYTTCYCFLICFATSAQSNTDISSSLNFILESNFKATIYLKNNSEATGIITQITDSTVVLSQSSQKENSIAYTSNIIAIPGIKIIKIKRHTFFIGMVSGAAITGFAGYEVGYNSYNDNLSVSEDENRNNADLKGYEGAVIGAVPGAVIGSIIGSIVVKRRFKINGDIKKIKAMMKTLWRFNIHT